MARSKSQPRPALAPAPPPAPDPPAGATPGAAGADGIPPPISKAEAGRRLQEARAATGFSQADAAARLNIHRSHLARLETGARVCDWPYLLWLIRGLDLDPATLFPELFPEKTEKPLASR